MSQSETLQDLYDKIADIYQKLCDGLTSTDDDPVTQITNQLVISNDWTSNIIQFENSESKESITKAQTEINEVLALALNLAKDEASENDATIVNAQGAITPVPTGSPITLLPKLIKLLVLYKAPLKFLMNALLDYIKEVILEHIKRKLNDKKFQTYQTIEVSQTILLEIPKDAEKMIFSFSNMPNWIGKRFEPISLNKSILGNSWSVSSDLAKYLGYRLGSVAFGMGITGTGGTSSTFWYEDFKFEYRKAILEIPFYEGVSNAKRYAYLYLELENTCLVSYVRKV